MLPTVSTNKTPAQNSIAIPFIPLQKNEITTIFDCCFGNKKPRLRLFIDNVKNFLCLSDKI